MVTFKRSIKNKLLLIYLLSIIPALLLAGAGFIAQDIYSLKQTLKQRINIQAEIIASNASIAILFNDIESTNEILQALEADQEIRSVRVSKSSQNFASYFRINQNLNKKSRLLNFFFEPELQIIQPILFKGKEIGAIEIISDYPTLHRHFKQYGLITSLLLLLSFFISFMIASRMQKAFLAPIHQLVNLTRHVAKDKNYTLKAKKTTADELGTLADNFNFMLEHINERDKNLEAEVEKRTEELVELNQTLNYRATHDSLTNLANRDLFNITVQCTIDRAHQQNHSFAIVFMDLDHFKLINDTMGHEFGDMILKQTAQRLSQNIRNSDTLARMGGDEFTVLLDMINHTTHISNIAKKILQSFERPFEIYQHEFHVKPSMGISIFPHDGEEAELLKKNADTAMYSAKKSGGNCFRFFSRQMSEQVHQRMSLEAELHKALQEKQLQLYYQPQLNSNHQLISFEALLRWAHPDRGIISPLEFISIAEETGQIIDIGKWVIEQACLQQTLWQKKNLNPLPIHINISPKQFTQPHLAMDILNTLNRFNLEKEMIAYEITESTFANDIEFCGEILQQFSQLGLYLSIDDFGTGYSSLSYLKEFPFNCLKIDKSFIAGMENSEKDINLVIGIIDLAHSLNLSVLAEGVETQNQLTILKQHRCDFYQGYYFSKPVPAEEAESWLTSEAYPSQ